MKSRNQCNTPDEEKKINLYEMESCSKQITKSLNDVKENTKSLLLFLSILLITKDFPVKNPLLQMHLLSRNVDAKA